MSDYIITTERISWLRSLREFHQLERDDEELDRQVKAREGDYRDHVLHGEDLEKRSIEATKTQAPIDQQHEELLYKVHKAKMSMEKERASRRNVEKLLYKEMELKDNQIAMERELLEQRYGFEIEKKQVGWEKERVKMRCDSVLFNEKLIVAEAEIAEMMKSLDAQDVMKREHKEHMDRLKDEYRMLEERWKVEIEEVRGQKSEKKTEVRSNDLRTREERKVKLVQFRREKAMRDIAWKKERTKMVRANRVLILKSSFTEHWINDLDVQIRSIGGEILDIKRSLTENIQDLEMKCHKLLLKRRLDPAPLRVLCREQLGLADMVPSGKHEDSIWRVVDGWK